jgi:snurportin-1
MPKEAERRSVKSALAIDQRRRQKEMFQRQKQTRSERINLARMLGASEASPADPAPAPEPPGHGSQADVAGMTDADAAPHQHQHSPGEAGQGAPRGRRPSVDLEEDAWAGQIMMPDWMLEAPDAMREKWLVAPRPQGKRCLVLASAGRTMSRLRTGKLLQVFQSPLPNGSAGKGAGRTGGHDYSVLDCIFVEELQCYFICDVMCWKGHALYDCTAEFRFFWLQQKLSEDAAHVSQHHPTLNPHPFHVLPWYSCDPAGLDAAYRSLAVPFTRDGLQFLHRDSHYENGLTPLMLVWKDSACSTYLSEVYKDVDPSIQVACLTVTAAGDLLTSDDPPIVVASAGAELAASFARNKKNLALFKIAGIALHYPEAVETSDMSEDDVQAPPQVSVGKIEFLAPAAAKRTDADSLTKALFQQRLRVQPLTYQELQHQAAV